MSHVPLPLNVTGPITIACLVILGIFVYPLLLKRPPARGRGSAYVAVVIATSLLTVVFYQFARDTQPVLLRGALAFFWAVAPLIAASIVTRLRSDKG